MTATAFAVTVLTVPVGSPSNRKEGTMTVYADGTDQQEAEDNVRTWMASLSDSSLVYTKLEQPVRRIGPVRTNPTGRAVGRVPASSLYVRASS
jgi:hypothetical protein